MCVLHTSKYSNRTGCAVAVTFVCLILATAHVCRCLAGQGPRDCIPWRGALQQVSRLWVQVMGRLCTDPHGCINTKL